MLCIYVGRKAGYQLRQTSEKSRREKSEEFDVVHSHKATGRGNIIFIIEFYIYMCFTPSYKLTSFYSSYKVTRYVLYFYVLNSFI